MTRRLLLSALALAAILATRRRPPPPPTFTPRITYVIHVPAPRNPPDAH